MPLQNKTYRYAKIIAPIDLDVLIQELAQIKEHLIISRSSYDVYLAPFGCIPNIITEIARLREHTFRLAGEGTGMSQDLDKYDKHYLHLFIWDRKNECIVGGYRLGPGKEIYDLYGIEGFYLNSLFEIEEDVFPVLKSALELGRSFIVPAYQKKHFPLLLLWRGILYYLIRHPQCQFLVGPVSISKYYSDISKSIIVSFIKKFCFDEVRSKYFSPRTAFHPHLGELDFDAVFDKSDQELGDLEEFLNSMEPDHIKVPVLLKQYAKQNAKFLGFNLDPNFSGALDGLMLLDIKELPAGTLEMLNR